MASEQKAGAEAHLAVIRHLLERTRTYRALSASGALAAGLLALFTAGGNIFFSSGNLPADAARFTWSWLLTLLIALTINLILKMRDSRSSGGRLLSPGFRAALECLAPAVVAFAVLTLLFLQVLPVWLAAIWSLLYGLALLGTSAFAPFSLKTLGWCFEIFGLCIFAGIAVDPHFAISVLNANCLMAASFGFFHLAYALVVFMRREREEHAG